MLVIIIFKSEAGKWLAGGFKGEGGILNVDSAENNLPITTETLHEKLRS